MQRYEHNISSHMLEPHVKGPWVKYETAAARISELEAELAQRTADTNAMVGNCEAKIAELEAQLAILAIAHDANRWDRIMARDTSDRCRARISELEAQLAAAQEQISIMQGLIGETIVDIPSSTSTSYPAPPEADHA